MVSRAKYFAFLSLPLLALAVSPDHAICVLIAGSISSASDVFYPGQPSYDKGVSHYASSSSQVSACVVEPGSASDVAIILGILGKTRTPFAVKGGGHAMNQGFSSTTGVHIAMSRFSEITYDAASQTAVLGAGLIWDDVYAALEPHNVNVLGGRVPGIGVAGFILGGGYSWKSNQFGLSIDTVTAFELVQPNGNVINVTKESHPGLFFGLKGGSNNFGIVTKFTLRAFPQTQVWGGAVSIADQSTPAIATATAKFAANVKDPKAAIITSLFFAAGSPAISLLLFYDGPSPPAGIFDDFLAVPSVTKDVKTRNFLSLVQSSPSNGLLGTRGVYNAVPILSVTPSILDVIINETLFWGTKLSSKTAFVVANNAEPFLPNVYSHNPDTTAFPAVRSLGFMPFNIAYAWNSSEFDNDFHEAARQSAATIHAAAISQGQTALSEAPLYPNYAVSGTPIANIYGKNLPALKVLKASVDPTNVMGLAGGFKI